MPQMMIPGPAGGGYSLSLSAPDTAMTSLIQMERFREMMAAQQAKQMQQEANRATDGALYLQQQFPQYSNTLKQQLEAQREQDKVRDALRRQTLGIQTGYFG